MKLIVTIDTEAVVISGLSGNTFNVSGLGQAHYSTNTVRVNVLTRNVVVRSSGTDVGAASDAGNTAYIENLATNATSLSLQSTTNLVSPGAWTTVSPAPVIVNGQNTVTNPITGPQQFFRLVQ